MNVAQLSISEIRAAVRRDLHRIFREQVLPEFIESGELEPECADAFMRQLVVKLEKCGAIEMAIQPYLSEQQRAEMASAKASLQRWLADHGVK